MSLRFAVLIAGLLVVSACGAAVNSHNGVGESFEGMIVETPQGAKLCEGAIRESAPPQCEGPELLGWLWEEAWGTYGDPGGRWGEFCFSGVRDGADRITLTAEPRPAGTCDADELHGVYWVVEVTDDLTGEVSARVCLVPPSAEYARDCHASDQHRELAVIGWEDVAWPEGELFSTVRQGWFRLHGIVRDEELHLTRRPEAVPASEIPADDEAPCAEPDEGELGDMPGCVIAE